MIDLLSNPVVLALCGLLSHFLLSLKEASNQQESLVTPADYFLRHPYQVSLSVVGAIAGVGALEATGQLTPIAGFGAGWLADSVPEKLGKVADTRFAGKG